jgi:hypothetical protein
LRGCALDKLRKNITAGPQLGTGAFSLSDDSSTPLAFKASSCSPARVSTKSFAIWFLLAITAGLPVNPVFASSGIKRLEARTGLAGDSAGGRIGDFSLRASNMVVVVTLWSRLVDPGPSLLNVTFEMDDVRDALLLRFVEDSSFWLGSQLLRLVEVEVGFTGDGRGAEALVGERK